MADLDHGRHKHRSRTRRSHRRERERTALDLDLIVDSAIAIADERGADAVTMRAVAARLGVGVMSLYWYVPTKKDLEGQIVLKLMAESAANITATGDWRADMASLARSARMALLRHDWIVDWVGRIDFEDQPNLIEGKRRHAERLMQVASVIPVDDQTRYRFMLTIDDFTRGFTLWEIIKQRQLDSMEATGDDTEREPAAQATHGPSCQIAPDIGELTHLELDTDAQFEFALQTLLDGIEAQIAQAAATSD